MNELTNEQILHIAHLARIEVTDDEIESYKKELKSIMDEINKINEINIDDEDYIFSTTQNRNVYREDEGIDEVVDIKLNAPKTSGNYIEVSRCLND